MAWQDLRFSVFPLDGTSPLALPLWFMDQHTPANHTSLVLFVMTPSDKGAKQQSPPARTASQGRLTAQKLSFP
jgi:hypothetical protein